ncbi:MAG: hypothetical protein QOJ49_1127 [Actinomycetota bacterium]|jgi:endonuclease/exonuclease/phosphatase family metal-dependent hydrolase|nr:hypothetical protein [Actinomycetota bacterium]
MTTRRHPVRRGAASLVAALAVLAVLATMAGPAQAAPAPGTGTPLTVMTRNLYLGGDITRPLAATAGKTGLAALVAFGLANHELRAIVDQTDFPARSKLLAREIAANEPDLVGLQEVAMWRHGPLELGQVGVANAETVDYDFLQTLLGDLAALGEPYVAVNVQQESDVEGPAFSSFNPFTGEITDGRDVRLTMRDVLLKRADDRMKVLASGGAQYTHRLDFGLAGVTFSFIRGYNWADVRVGAKSVRVVNTHLESQSSDLALLQAMELVAGPGKPGARPVIVVCDCNSDPLNHSVKPTDPGGTPHSGPYDFLTGPGGLTDEWLRFAPADQGFTSGFSETVNDPDTSSIDHRIDMVFARPAMPVVWGRIVGTDPANRSPGGLWPSDHAGVVMRLRP